MPTSALLPSISSTTKKMYLAACSWPGADAVAAADVVAPGDAAVASAGAVVVAAAQDAEPADAASAVAVAVAVVAAALVG